MDEATLFGETKSKAEKPKTRKGPITRIIPGYLNKDVIAFMRAKLATDPEWAKRALERLYQLQTDEEVKKRLSIEDNFQGFTKFDAPRLTRLAELSRKGKLVKIHTVILQELIQKYAVQIARLANKTQLKAKLDVYFRFNVIT